MSRKRIQQEWAVSDEVMRDLVNAGAIWVDEPAFRDGNLVWGRVVEDIPAFNRELVKALAAKP